jgi:hypothetical protein
VGANITIAVQPIKSSLTSRSIMHRPSAESWTYRNRARTYYEQKDRPKAAFRSLEGIAYAALSAILFFRRYAMKPMPAKPRIIIARVGGSGTGEGMTTESK